MSATIAENSERLVRLETKLEYVDAILDNRQTIISAHSRRLADIEMHIRDHHRINIDHTARIAKLEASYELTKEERLRKRHTQAILQWITTGLIGLGVIVGLLTSGESAILKQILGGWLQLP